MLVPTFTSRQHTMTLTMMHARHLDDPTAMRNAFSMSAGPQFPSSKSCEPSDRVEDIQPEHPYISVIVSSQAIFFPKLSSQRQASSLHIKKPPHSLIMRFTSLLMAALTTMVIASPIAESIFREESAALDPRDPAVLSIGTSPGCGADCPVCGDETCACGNSISADRRPCCNGYESTGENLPNCVSTLSARKGRVITAALVLHRADRMSTTYRSNESRHHQSRVSYQ